MPVISSAFSVKEKLGGKPVELYTFARGAWTWLYTSSNTAVTVESTGLTYMPAKIQRGELQRKDETGAQKVELTFGRRLGIVAALRDGTTAGMICSIHRYHASAGGLPILLIRGDVGAVGLDGSVATCNLVSTEGRFPNPVPRALITQQCQLAVYSARCGLDAQLWKFDTTIATISRSLISVASVDGNPDKYYSNGILGVSDFLVHIESQIGTDIKIFGNLPESVSVGDTVSLFKGCDKTLAACLSFDNVRNMLGFPYLPQTNPLLIRAGS